MPIVAAGTRVQAQPPAVPAPAPASSKPSAGAARSTDKVTLSPQARELERQLNQSTPDERKVEKIKQALADGQFQVNSDKVQDGLLETVKELLRSRRTP